MANEKRLIDANALITNLRTFEGLGRMVAETLVRFTEKQPTVDAVEVVHGRWDKNWSGDNIVYCDRCYMPQDMPTPYCPNCGAKMDGGNEDV